MKKANFFFNAAVLAQLKKVKKVFNTKLKHIIPQPLQVFSESGTMWV
jgi:hypothetical protein